MPYTSPTAINVSNGFGDMLIYINTVTDYWVSRLFIIGIWFILLIGIFKVRDDFTEGLVGASFVTFVVSLLFWIGGFVDLITMTTATGIFIISILVLIGNQN